MNKIQKLIIYLFVFAGPLGNLLTPHFLPSPTRTYYVFLLLFPMLYIPLKKTQTAILLSFCPFFLYALFSSLSVQLWKVPDEPYPLFRFFLLLCHFLFCLGASMVFKEREEKHKLLKIYISSYFLSLSIGYVFFIGHLLHVIPFSFIQKFSVLGQFGYGMLRFAPGSYPNEYATVSSFVLSLLMLLLFQKNPFWPKKILVLLFLPAFAALLLTTTRSAYISFLLCFFYLALKHRKISFLLFTSVIMASGIFLLQMAGIPLFSVFSLGFKVTSFLDGSLGERVLSWQEGWQLFLENLWMGTGFFLMPNLHNVYLQLLFELGILGFFLLLGGSGVLLWQIFKQKYKNSKDAFFHQVCLLALFHAAWFALSNHNINHHLTWFAFLLLGLRYFSCSAKLPVSSEGKNPEYCAQIR